MGRKKKRSKRATQPAELRDRVKRLRDRLKETDADALLVSNPRDIRYLTGFIGDDSWAVVPTRGRIVTIISDFRFAEQIEREAPHARAIMRKKGLADELTSLMDKRGYERIALQEDYVTLAQRKALMKKIGARRLLHWQDKLIEQRAIKGQQEVRAIRKALRIQQQAFAETLEFMQSGQTEAEVCAYLEYRIRTLGADGVSFPSIVAAGANSSLPHAIPGRTKIRRNHIVLFDWGARWGGYCSDLTRVVAIGKMPAKVREIYKVVLDAQMAAIDAIAPGKPAKEVDEAARTIIKDAGYAEHFGHGLGHGIGLDIHERPVFSWRSEDELAPGHVVTVEPGIYLPGVGGVRIEDDVLVTDRGCKVLSDLPKDLESAMI